MSFRRRMAALFAGLLLPLAAAGQSEGVRWRSDLHAAQAEAHQDGKLILAHFWSETCGPCRMLDNRVFAQPPVAMAIDQQYVPVKINASESPELARQYGVTRVPTDAVLTAAGELVTTFVSPPTPMDYVGHVTRVATAHNTRPGAAFAAAASAAPDSGRGVPLGQPQPASATTAQPQHARFAGNPASTAPAPARGPAATQNPYAAAASQPVANPSPASLSLQLPPGSPPLVFEGYCTVTMKKENRWAQGDTRWGAIHEGGTYLFAGPAEQQAFLAEPDAYSPVLGGADPVVAIDQRRSLPGSREFALEYEGRFYLFSSEQSLERFWNDPTTYADGARRVAALPAGGPLVR